jgi:hypothetical protein
MGNQTANDGAQPFDDTAATYTKLGAPSWIRYEQHRLKKVTNICFE